jgi:hypothetical protein
VDVFEWNSVTGKGALLFQSVSVQYARSAIIGGNVLVIADTFGMRVVMQDMTSGQVLHDLPSFYPNDLAWRDGLLYVIEEHNDRIVSYSDSTLEKTVVMAAPAAALWNASQVIVTTSQTCNGTQRSMSSDLCSGAYTLYAPNGFSVRSDGMFVADTDNSRIIYVKDGVVVSVFSGLNNPVKVAEIPAH